MECPYVLGKDWLSMAYVLKMFSWVASGILYTTVDGGIIRLSKRLIHHLRELARFKVGKFPSPTASIVDS